MHELWLSDFGAALDGVTDDTEAWKNALEYIKNCGCGDSHHSLGFDKEQKIAISRIERKTMKVQFSLVGDAAEERRKQVYHHYEKTGERIGEDIWVETLQIPREGDIVDIPGIDQSLTTVRTVVWYPLGCDEYEEGHSMYKVPMVYVVIGNPRL